MADESGRLSKGGHLQLALTPAESGAATGSALDHLAGDEGGTRRMLAVTTGGDADAFVDAILDALDRQPRDLVVFELDETTRSASGRDRQAGGGRIRSVVTASDDGGLDGVLVTLEALAEEWESAPETVFYLDSLSELVYDVGLLAAVDWLASLGPVLRTHGWTGVLRLDDDRHDERTLALLAQPFDEVVSPAGDGQAFSPIELSAFGEQHTGTGTDRVPLDAVFTVLCSRDRRLILRRLGRSDGPTPVADIAEFVLEHRPGEPADRDGDTPSRVHTALHHVHLAKLENAGLVSYDGTTDAVSLNPAARQLEPFLLLTHAEDDDD